MSEINRKILISSLSCIGYVGALLRLAFTNTLLVPKGPAKDPCNYCNNCNNFINDRAPFSKLGYNYSKSSKDLATETLTNIFFVYKYSCSLIFSI